MNSKSNLPNWITVSESSFSWEREALDFVRNHFPAHELYRAWSNFEFIAHDGSINEVDLLVFTPQGFFLIEIKSRPGRLYGDAGTWTWETEGRLVTTDNPLIATNTKAKKLRSLLESQNACRKKGKLPFIEPLVFCSAPDLRCELAGTACYRVCLRDREREGNIPPRPGIIAAIKRRECPGLFPQPKGFHDRPTAKMIGQAMEQAGIRPSQRHRQVSDYRLNRLISEGSSYQDWEATHVHLPKTQRRVRLYLIQTQTAAASRSKIERAARREWQLLETLEHPGILRTYGYTEHELGPALIFEYDAQAIRLDHYLTQRQDSLNVEMRLELIRQIAEAINFAHQKKVVHRGLCPQSILVSESNGRPKIKIFNWQIAYQTSMTTSVLSVTSQVDGLVEDVSTAYLAPEALVDESILGEHLDVFSLGAIAFHLFSSQAPAANGLELSQKLRETKGLKISSVLNGASDSLQYLIQYSTHPEVANRTDSVVDFLRELDCVEAELTAPEGTFVEDPTLAQKEDLLPGNFRVIRRLGQGASSVALLVERDREEWVLKVANDAEHNSRLQDEAEVLQKLRHSNIVEYCGSLEISHRNAFLLQPVFVDKEKRVETLGQRLRKEGRLHIELLQRFGEDLLDVVKYLEEKGISHRDIKPDNIVVGQIGRAARLHLVLFDFSLSRTAKDNIRAGTKGYLDPLLPLRNPPSWDLNAERYAAAVTLYEMATGTLPKWGDGTTDPSHLDCEITLDAELFDASLRDDLTDFFRKAFRRNLTQRFDNAEEMLRAWRLCFEGIEQQKILSDHENESELKEILADATFSTAIAELGLGMRAINALDRTNILTVAALLNTPRRKLSRLRGVGNRTRREIAHAVKILGERLGVPPANELISVEDISQTDLVDADKLSVDLLAQKITRIGSREEADVQRILNTLLGLEPQREQLDRWWSQSELANYLELPRELIAEWVDKFQTRWSKEPAITKLREDLVEILKGAEGVMSVAELAEAILVARGSIQDEPLRSRLATAVLRVAVEVETRKQTRFLIQRDWQTVLVALSAELASYAFELGKVADELADADPLVSPARAVGRLREVPCFSEIISDTRLLRLAAAASQRAAVSSRQEIYPRDMEAIRTLKLSQGALYGVRTLTVQQIRDRVSSRYPEAAPLPERPMLDELLKKAGLDLDWEQTAGGYTNPLHHSALISSSVSLSRSPTGSGTKEPGEITPEIADARQFEEKLQRSLKEGAFLALLVKHERYQQACQELRDRFPIEPVDFEGLFIETLRQVADKAKVNWDLVLKTDATPYQGDWDKLMLLVGRAMPIVEAKLASPDKTILLTYPGLLARYDHMTLLERLRERIGRVDALAGLWLLIPGEREATIDAKAVPLLSAGQRSRIPESWLCNVHRAY